MLEMIIKRKWYLQKHLDAPLLKERENYLEMMAQKGIVRSSLLSMADYLLLIVNMLPVTDEQPRKITIQEIKVAAELWSDTIKNHPMKRQHSPSSVTKFMTIAFSWLSHIGMLDDLYCDSSLILNRLFERKHHKLRYLTYPLLDERSSHLEKWESMGASVGTLREIAAYQLHAIDLLHVENGNMVTEDELRSAAVTWARLEKSGLKSSDGKYARKRFLSHVRDWLVSINQYVHPVDVFPLKKHVMEYLHWLKDENGYSQTTVDGRYSMLKGLMKSISPASMESITPQKLDSYLLKRGTEEGCCRRTISGTCSVLRDFFRYGQMKGWNPASLALSLKAPRTYKNEDIPSFVPWDVVQEILEERRGGKGTVVRDYAILLLLSVYGMRCSEVTGMKIKDIDWRKEQIYLRRAKGCKPQIMPLLKTVGDAIIRYIREVRFNDVRCEYLFVGRRAPHGKLTNSAVYRMVRDALKAHGVQLRHYGPHSLRHGRATQLINTGYSLKEIADIFGHMRLDTTTIYAKVNMTTLREVADMNWEGLL